ncbi:protein kinase domain-containing protein [Yinghuangia sp. YIM S09857]|uniref:protein kinase domain-containing protein n=1 Tax=Yinghuangia sp. YIM S09857 TaxID=3436929 RepID=UPI003F5323A7
MTTERRLRVGDDEVVLSSGVAPKGGGQAAVYPLADRPGTVVKLYREPQGPDQERRVERMLNLTPLGGRPTNTSQPPELAWPTAVVRGVDGEFLGYAMRRFGEPEHVPLIGLFTRAQRLRCFPPRTDWRFLLGVCWNLAFMTARMHHEGLVIGDFSSNNIVVDGNGFVTLLDCDSIAFTDPASGEHFPALMQTADYSAPERQAGGPATRHTDNFALAVLIYQLLTVGNHPFGGVPHGSSSDSTIKDNIAASCSYVVHPEAVTTPRNMIEPTVLPPSLLALARQAFGPGVHQPDSRPSAEDWLRALDSERSRVETCPARPRHTYGFHLTTCPWCTRTRATGQDPFNLPPPRPPLPTPPPTTPPPTSTPFPRTLLYALIALVAVLAVAVALAAGS